MVITDKEHRSMMSHSVASYLLCGCSTARINGLLTRWDRCAVHYTPEDDAKVLEASKNLRSMDDVIHVKALWEQSKN